ncbi:MAG TPA: OpgC domain-containing protein [Verrucomicrobiae bacterium]|nr:OpgC domain-containing protein [Verrucomicrobiae bacterium]
MPATKCESTRQAPLRQTPRDCRLDALRGLLLILMTVRHLPSVLGKYTFEYFGYLSEAEGFVLLSGFVAGLSYTRLASQHPASTLSRQAFLRARTIYLYHAAIFILSFLIIKIFSRDEEYASSWDELVHLNPAVSLVAGITCLNQPKFLDILPMYCIFVLNVPLIIQAFRRKLSWLVLALSALLWGITQFGFRTSTAVQWLHNYLPVNLGEFEVCSWQVLFVAGLYLGFRSSAGGIMKPCFGRLLVVYLWGIAICLMLVKHHIVCGTEVAYVAERMSDKPTLGALRIFNFAIVYMLLIHYGWNLRPGLVVHGLAYLGRRSLQVFGWHVLVVIAAGAFYELRGLVNEEPRIVVVAACIAALYIPAYVAQRQKRPSPA